MPVVEVTEPLVKVDDNEDDEVNVDSTKRCCRNFLIFTDTKNFPASYFPTKKPKAPHRTFCPVTGLPARYHDPVTGLPYANAHAFRYIGERYAMQAEEMKGKASEIEQRLVVGKLNSYDHSLHQLTMEVEHEYILWGNCGTAEC